MLAQLFFEPKDYYALVDLKTPKILLVHEISSENDANRIIDGNNFRGEAFAIILLLLYLYPQRCSDRSPISFREMNRKLDWFLGNINKIYERSFKYL